MALDVESVVKVPVIAWIVVDDVEYEISSLSINYSGANATAEATFAVGRPLSLDADIRKQVTNEQAQSIILDLPAQIWIQSESNIDLPGLPKEPFMAFDGYIVDSGPWRVAGGGNEFGYGVKLVHRDLADLSTGSTAVWPYTTTVNFDWLRPNSVIDGLWLSGMLSSSNTAREIIRSEGLWPAFQKFFTKVAEGPGSFDSDSLAGKFARQGCGPEIGQNQVALAALSRIQLPEGVSLKIDARLDRFLEFLDEKLSNDLRTMSFVGQIQAIGDQLMFRMVPRADGSLLVVPFKTFEETAHVEFGSDQIFDFQPSGGDNPRVTGVLLYGPPIGISVFDTGVAVVGCYVFEAGSRSPRGIISAVNAPSWLGPNAYPIPEQTRNTLLKTVEASAPEANEPEETPLTEYDQALERYGNFYARELARQFRFRDSSVQFSSYLRTDVGPQSTIRVQAPGTIGEETALFGKVDAVRIMIDAGSKTAKTDFVVGYARNETIQKAIEDYAHPIYDDGAYPGGPL